MNQWQVAHLQAGDILKRLHERCRHVIAGYLSERKLSTHELSALSDLMWAAALACGFYRWREFNVNKPDSAPAAKESYLIMQQRCEVLEAMSLDPSRWL